MKVTLDTREVQDIDAEALLLPVDGAAPRLGSGAGRGLRAALSPDERMAELEYVEFQLGELGALEPHAARVIEGVARWRWIVVAAAYPHNVGGRIFQPHECATMLRAAIPNAIRAAVQGGAGSLALTMIGTAYRVPRDLSARAIADGIAVARDAALTVVWSVPHADDQATARDACTRLGLVAG